METAPIIVFAFNRLEPLKVTISSLLSNSESSESKLFVFVDGPRKDKNGENKKVEEVRNFIRSITGFKSIEYQFSENNRGLGNSIIAGVTAIINRYGRAIVLEDDLVLSGNFLSFMNHALNQYENEKNVFSICGYSNKVKVPFDYHYDAYFCTRSSSWGWATWADRWNSVDWELKDWDRYQQHRKEFNRWGGSDCWKMLNDWHDGRNKSWAIRFCFSQFLQNKFSLFPVISKVRNDGFDGLGTNCKKWSRFKYEYDLTDSKSFRFPGKIEMNQCLYRSAMKYHSLWLRIYSRIMYIINK